jgi:hypothetical protein
MSKMSGAYVLAPDTDIPPDLPPTDSERISSERSTYMPLLRKLSGTRNTNVPPDLPATRSERTIHERTKCMPLLRSLLVAVGLLIGASVLLANAAFPAVDRTERVRNVRSHPNETCDNSTSHESRDPEVIRRPFMLWPGMMGSRLYLEALDKHDFPSHMHCHSTNPKHTLWLNTTAVADACDYWEFLPDENFEQKTNVSVNIDPVFGSQESVSCLVVGTWLKLACKANTDAAYLGPLLKILRANYYTSFDLFVATPNWEFDVRSSVHDRLYESARVFAEETYRQTGEPLVILAHSNGGLFLKHWLEEVMPPEWSKKYVRVQILVAVPTAGSVQALKMFTTGEAMRYCLWTGGPCYTLVTKERTKSFARSSSSVPPLLPDARAFGRHVIAKYRNNSSEPYKLYTAADVPEVLADSNVQQASIKKYNEYHVDSSITISRPTVDTHCIYGKGTNTPTTLVFDGTWGNLSTIDTDGDGTVSLHSADVCERWREEGEHDANAAKVTIKYLQHKHINILQNPDFFDEVLALAVTPLGFRHRRTLRTLIDGAVCYSKYPVYACDDSRKPVRSHLILVSYVCFSNRDEIRQHNIEYSKGPMYFPGRDADVTVEYNEPTYCKK